MSRQHIIPSLGTEAVARFWSKVDKSSDCWTWNGATNQQGYGRFKVGKQVLYAHRVAYALEHGDVGDDLIRSTCGNESCVNPAHLEREQIDRPAKASKPRPDFPLFPHASGRWAKKVLGKFNYFGRVDEDPNGQAALKRWLDAKDDLLAGRVHRAKRDGLTIDDLCQHFLHAKKVSQEAGEIAPSTWKDYRLVCKFMLDHFGRSRLVDDIHPEDFDQLREAIAKTGNLVTQGNTINRIRIVLKYGYEAGLLDKPLRYGANFKRPSRKALRRTRTARMFEVAELTRMLDAATVPMHAMILLGLNCGFGNSDVGRLPINAIDLKKGWLSFPRPKTGTDRKVPLWPETIEAIKAALASRPDPVGNENAGLVFLTSWGGPWHKEGASYLSEQFRKFIQGIDRLEAEAAKREKRKPLPNLYRKGVGFYTLRHVFETIGGESCDQVAVDSLMGHERGDMASNYRERVSDERLRKVVDTVHAWLFCGDESEDATEDVSREEHESSHRFRVVG